MIKGLMALGVVAIVAASIVTPLSAQPVVQEPGAQSFYYPNSSLGIGTAWPQGGASNAMASTRNVSPAPVTTPRTQRGGAAGVTR
jgi:hypothetical protein